MDRIDVIYAYKLLLGRVPESDTVINERIDQFSDIYELSEELLTSKEFKNTRLFNVITNFMRSGIKDDLFFLTPWGSQHHISCYKSDNTIRKTITHDSGYYEKHVMSALRRVLKPESVCLDVGANVGIHSVVMSELAYDGLIFSFEPVGQLYNLLCGNTCGASNIWPYKLALSNNVSSGHMNYHEVWAGDSFLITDKLDDNSVPVDMTTLDFWTEQMNLESLDLIKFDIEGHELFALQGAMRTLDLFNPICIIEYFPKGLKKQSCDTVQFKSLIRELFDYIYLIERESAEFIFVHDMDSLDHPEDDVIGATKDLICSNYSLL